MKRRPNKALHLTKRVGAPASQAIVEAAFAAERGCSADVTASDRGLFE
jgi:hypothetical protein